jgi:hypothetical protein
MDCSNLFSHPQVQVPMSTVVHDRPVQLPVFSEPQDAGTATTAPRKS